jgi:hypothetical protein
MDRETEMDCVGLFKDPTLSAKLTYYKSSIHSDKFTLKKLIPLQMYISTERVHNTNDCILMCDSKFSRRRNRSRGFLGCCAVSFGG